MRAKVLQKQCAHAIVDICAIDGAEVLVNVGCDERSEPPAMMRVSRLNV